MKPAVRLSLAVALCGAAFPASAQFASSVVSYEPGVGYAVEFGTGNGYTRTGAALGAPSASGPWGEIDPFNAQSGIDEIVSLGVGGSLVVRLDQPAVNSPANPYGMDFIVFGNAGFIIINGDYTGGGVTDGSLYGHNTGSTRVSVSADGVSFYTLDLSLAPVADGYFPTDPTGDFTRPMDPALTGLSFDNQDMAGIRSLYAGSAGGTAFDLDWARDDQNQPVALGSVEYIRIDVVSGRAEIDGFAAVGVVPVPEPTALTLAGLGLAALVWGRKRNAA